MKKGIRVLSFLPLVAFSFIAVVVLSGCQQVEKPELKGEGALTLTLTPGVLSPEYHQPVDYWKTHHMDLINRGDFNKQECTLCHNVHTSCNNCHDYVGVTRVEGYE